jgi:hypothetical protein
LWKERFADFCFCYPKTCLQAIVAVLRQACPVLRWPRLRALSHLDSNNITILPKYPHPFVAKHFLPTPASTSRSVATSTQQQLINPSTFFAIHHPAHHIIFRSAFGSECLPIGRHWYSCFAPQRFHLVHSVLARWISRQLRILVIISFVLLQASPVSLGTFITSSNEVPEFQSHSSSNSPFSIRCVCSTCFVSLHCRSRVLIVSFLSFSADA